MNTNKIARGILGMEDIFFHVLFCKFLLILSSVTVDPIMEQQNMRGKAGKEKRTHA